MKTALPCLTIIICLCPLFVRAQNLVPNPGFENPTQCPYDLDQVYLAVPWQSLSGGGNYFHTCGNAPLNVPNNLLSYLPAAEGNAYASYHAWDNYMAPNGSWRQYLYTPLTGPMVAGTVYHVSFKATFVNPMSPGNYQPVTSDMFGVHFGASLPTAPPAFSPPPIPVASTQPLVTVPHNTWTDISFDYTATGGEQYMVVGNFKDNASTTFVPAYPPYPGNFSIGFFAFVDKFVVDANPPLFQSGDTMLCVGESTTLTAYNGDSFTWAATTAPGVILGTGPTFTVSPTVTTSYYIYSPNVTDTVTVHVYPPITVNAGTDITVCPQQPVTLAGSGAGTYTWTGGINNGVPFTPVLSTATYVLTGSNGGCTDTDTVTVSVNPVGCPGFPNTHGCDIDAIRQAFTAAGCQEMVNSTTACGLYYLNPQLLSAGQAQAFAQNLGANLASVSSAAENAALVASLTQMGFNNAVWIGLADQQNIGSFTWYDQTPTSYTNWMPGEPGQNNNEDCVQMISNGRWNTLPCSGIPAASIVEVNLCPVANAGPEVWYCTGNVALEADTRFGSSPYTYTWSNGAQAQGTTVWPGISTDYWVTSTDRYGCTDSDTVTVNVGSPLVIDLGNDTVVCQGDNLLLVAYQGGAHIAGTQYIWHNGNTTPFFTPSQSGTYWVTATLNGCSASDTIEVIFNPNPVVDLGPDAILCTGQALTLDATTANATYLWQDGGSGPTYTVQQGGTYGVTVSVGGCTAQDETNITEHPVPAVNLGNDASLCQGTPLTLDATTAGATYLWQNNATTATLLPTQTGLYWVQVTLNGCAARDTIQLTFLPLPAVNLGNDTLPCMGDTVLLDAGNSPGYTYLWQDGSTLPAYTVTQTGTYGVQVTGGNGCQNTDAVTLTYIHAPQISFTDSTLCKGDVWLLDITTPAATYLWQDKSVLPTYTIHGEGTYWATVTNPCGSASDTMEVASQRCDCFLYIPDSFTPNGDFHNERFMVTHNTECTLEEYTLSVFNRWGELIFETGNIEFLWDGTKNGKTVPMDVYTYRVQYKFNKGVLSHRWGHISLLR